jgi:membrane-associated phospholipid phosphatase
MRTLSLFLVVLFVCAALIQAPLAGGQNCTDLDGHPQPCPTSPGEERAPAPESVAHDGRKFAVSLLEDQKDIWTSPLRLKLADSAWLAPVAGITAGLMLTDRISAPQLVGAVNHVHRSAQFSDLGLGLLGVTAGSSYLLGVHHQDDHQREAGLLSLEAGADSLGVDEVFKYAFRRARPNEDGGAGRFFQSGGDSFPSDHAAVAFSIATVLAKEYPAPATQLLAYGSATAISLARVAGQRHFPSDVFVGGALGYLIGRSVYAHHHAADTEAGYDNFNTTESDVSPLSAGQMSSPYVELDSWIYPAIERLQALGVVNAGFMGLRPWTRMAIFRMLDGAEPQSGDASVNELIAAVTAELKREARLDAGSANRAIAVDEVYSRTQYISGTPLNDSFHFGQTLTNDFGRPYGSGAQQIEGFESHADSGRFSFFVRGEYQHSPSVPGYSAAQNQAIATQDITPGQTFNGLAAGNAFRLLDTYVAMKLWGHDLSVGKQSFWWGPDDSSAMTLSDNAEPFYALRINRTNPLYLPLLSKLLGPFRWDAFLGELAGDRYPRRPFIHGEKVSFRPTVNLEFGFSRTATFAGEGVSPLTFGDFWNSFTSTSSGTGTGFSLRNDPGARHGGFDFSYRLPGVRNWLTLYADSLVHDDISPIDAPRRAAVTPGLYLAKVPGLARLDLHVEGGTTDTVVDRAKGGDFYYWESIYKDSYTDKGNLLGSWLGREGTGGQAWATYWLSPQNTLKVGYRTLTVSRFFVPQGETQHAGYTELRHAWSNGLAVQGMLQVECWRAPLLAATPQVDVTTQVQVSFRPSGWGRNKK